jgi:hypothetical protein
MASRPSVSVVIEQGRVSPPAHLRQGAMAMLGFAQRFRPTRRSQDWMEELREGSEWSTQTSRQTTETSG